MKGIYLLSLITLFSCSRMDSELSSNGKTKNGFSVIDQWAIPLDSIAAPKILFYHENSDDRLIFSINKLVRAIDIYDLKDEQLVSRILLEKDGPNGVKEPSWLHVKSIDSIYVFSSTYYLLSLINSEGRVLQAYKLLQDRTKQGYIASINDRTRRDAGTVLLGDDLYVMCIPLHSKPFKKEKFYGEGFVNMKIDLTTGDIAYNTGFPEKYLKKDLPIQFGHQYYRVYNPDRGTFIYSFALDDHLYEISLDGEYLGSYLATSEKFYEVPEIQRKGGYRPEEDIKHFSEHPSFERILYNKYQKEYYRYIKYPRKESFKIPSSNSREGVTVPKSGFSIVVLNEKFEKLKEVDLPYFYQNNFRHINKDGLIVRKVIEDDEEMELHSLGL